MGTRPLTGTLLARMCSVRTQSHSHRIVFCMTQLHTSYKVIRFMYIRHHSRGVKVYFRWCRKCSAKTVSGVAHAQTYPAVCACARICICRLCGATVLQRALAAWPLKAVRQFIIACCSFVWRCKSSPWRQEIFTGAVCSAIAPD